MSWRVLVALGITVSLANSVYAQPQLGGAPRPAFSPYLNLVRPGASPALNYYGLVRPEMQARQSIQNLQGSVGANQQAIGNLQGELSDLSGTGHQATFLNHQSYFMTNSQLPTMRRNTGQAILSSGFNRLPSPGGSGGAALGARARR